MENNLTREEKVSLVNSKINTCIIMQENLETYVLEETNLGVVKEYQDSIEEYKSIINALKAFKEIC